MKTLLPFRIKGAFAVLVLFLIFSANLIAQPQYFNYQNVGTSSNGFPFNQAAGKAVNWLFLPGDLNMPTPAPAGNITKVYFFISIAGSRTFTNMRILMAQTNLTTLTTGQFYAGPWDTVYFQASPTHTGALNDWMGITLDTPYPYNPAMSLMVFVEQCGATGSGLSVRQNVLADIRRVWSIGGCPVAPFAGGDGSIVNFGVDITPGGPGPNFALRLPTPGVNTNYVAIPHQAGMIGFTNYTIEAWVKVGGFTTPNTILNKGATSFDYQLGINSTGIPFVRNQGSVATSTGFIVSAGVWTHVAATFDGANVRFYKDGALTSTVPLATLPGSSTNEMRIGRGGGDPGSGNIEEVRLWSVARTQGAIDSNKCRKYPSQFSSSAGLKGLWHLDSNLVDSVSGFNGNVMGNIAYDTTSFPAAGMNCNLVAIEPINNIIPKVFSLEQNYPNPFNPTTSIKFSIPKGGFVELKIYDLLGKEVATLVQDPFEAGTYSVTFEASKLASGVYFYSLVSGDFKDTKKMLLVK